MKAVCGRTVSIVCLMSIVISSLSGCTIGGKSFSIDSNSRIPFFGLELKERKPKSTAPSFQSISQTNRDASDVKIALQVGPGSPTAGLKKRDNRLVSTSLTDRNTLKSLPSKGVASKGVDVQTTSIPLPTTDVGPAHVESRKKSPAVDFQ